jgi:hypothetical protein
MFQFIQCGAWTLIACVPIGVRHMTKVDNFLECNGTKLAHPVQSNVAEECVFHTWQIPSAARKKAS